jgi:hypothetical protein
VSAGDAGSTPSSSAAAGGGVSGGYGDAAVTAGTGASLGNATASTGTHVCVPDSRNDHILVGIRDGLADAFDLVWRPQVRPRVVLCVCWGGGVADAGHVGTRAVSRRQAAAAAAAHHTTHTTFAAALPAARPCSRRTSGARVCAGQRLHAGRRRVGGPAPAPRRGRVCGAAPGAAVRGRQGAGHGRRRVARAAAGHDLQVCACVCGCLCVCVCVCGVGVAAQGAHVGRRGGSRTACTPRQPWGPSPHTHTCARGTLCHHSRPVERSTVDANGMGSASGVHIRLIVSRGLKATPYQAPRVTLGKVRGVCVWVFGGCMRGWRMQRHLPARWPCGTSISRNCGCRHHTCCAAHHRCAARVEGGGARWGLAGVAPRVVGVRTRGSCAGLVLCAWRTRRPPPPLTHTHARAHTHARTHPHTRTRAHTHHTRAAGPKERGIRLFTVHIRRGPPDVQDPGWNSLSKLNCIAACIQVRVLRGSWAVAGGCRGGSVERLHACCACARHPTACHPTPAAPCCAARCHLRRTRRPRRVLTRR